MAFAPCCETITANSMTPGDCQSCAIRNRAICFGLNDVELAQLRKAGIARSADDRYRGAVIEQLLCNGSARTGARLLSEVHPAPRPVLERELASIDKEHVTILPVGLPYARTIAALFDPWRRQRPRGGAVRRCDVDLTEDGGRTRARPT